MAAINKKAITSTWKVYSFAKAEDSQRFPLLRHVTEQHHFLFWMTFRCQHHSTLQGLLSLFSLFDHNADHFSKSSNFEHTPSFGTKGHEDSIVYLLVWLEFAPSFLGFCSFFDHFDACSSWCSKFDHIFIVCT